MRFEERVLGLLVKYASVYKEVFLDYEYLLYNPSFIDNPYYIVSAVEGHFGHLTGVHSIIPAKDFFIKCYNSTISETDFDLMKRYINRKDMKGAIVDKMKAFGALSTFFSSKLQAKENFSKGKIHCHIATTDSQVTVGFVNNKYANPKTLLKGNELFLSRVVDISLVLRRDHGTNKFDTIIQGDIESILSAHSELARITV